MKACRCGRLERVVGCSINTVDKLLREAGIACAIYHDEHVRELTTKRVQVDEIWSFTYAKAKNVADAKAAPYGAGDTWTWTAIDADSKLIVSWFVGGRDARVRLVVHEGRCPAARQPRPANQRWTRSLLEGGRAATIPLRRRNAVPLGPAQ